MVHVVSLQALQRWQDGRETMAALGRFQAYDVLETKRARPSPPNVITNVLEYRTAPLLVQESCARAKRTEGVTGEPCYIKVNFPGF